jgi:hypothetical protein
MDEPLPRGVVRRIVASLAIGLTMVFGVSLVSVYGKRDGDSDEEDDDDADADADADADNDDVQWMLWLSSCLLEV